jgi:hypothetical protein
VYCDGELIAQAKAAPPTEPKLEPRTKLGWLKRKRQLAERKANREGVTFSLTDDTRVIVLDTDLLDGAPGSRAAR